MTILTAMGNVLRSCTRRTRRSPCTTAWSTSPATARGNRLALRSIPSQRAMVPLGPIACKWFRRFIDVRDADGAERALLTAIAADLPPSTLADVLASAATDHFFLDGGHTLDFVNKACELLDMIGWQEADDPAQPRARAGDGAALGGAQLLAASRRSGRPART